ncbi:MAG: pilus assembly protein [Rhodospirillales bacterium]|nr:pilus assembly protein [Rhodospirillales bacterium]
MEFALVGSVLMVALFGILSTGLLLWTEGGLQSAATAAARCGALASPLCTNVTQYAVTQAQNWVTSGIIGTGNVSVSANATSCNGATGTFEVVTITCPFWSSLPPPLSGITLKVKGCYPT